MAKYLVINELRGWIFFKQTSCIKVFQFVYDNASRKTWTKNVTENTRLDHIFKLTTIRIINTGMYSDHWVEFIYAELKSTNQQGCKTISFDQNTYHTEYNETSAFNCNPGQHAIGIKNKNLANSIIFNYAWIVGLEYGEGFLTMGSTTKEKITTTTIKNTMKWVKKSQLIFYKNKTNFRSQMKLRRLHRIII